MLVQCQFILLNGSLILRRLNVGLFSLLRCLRWSCLLPYSLSIRLFDTQVTCLSPPSHAFQNWCPFICRLTISVGTNMAVSKVSSRYFALVSLYYALWLAGKTCATFSTGEKQTKTQSCLASTHFPRGAVGTAFVYLLRILIGWLRFLRLLWLTRVSSLYWTESHSIELIYCDLFSQVFWCYWITT